MKNVNVKTQELAIVSDTDIISVNCRKRLNDIQAKFPNLEIIIGAKTDDDKPVPIDMADMDHSRTAIFDAATETVLGKRVDKIQRSPKFPLSMVTGLAGFLLGVAACFLVYNI